MSRKRTLKLIYKIYDKYSTKDKEILNKNLQRWKNSTFKGNINNINEFNNGKKILIKIIIIWTE